MGTCPPNHDDHLKWAFYRDSRNVKRSQKSGNTRQRSHESQRRIVLSEADVNLHRSHGKCEHHTRACTDSRAGMCAKHSPTPPTYATAALTEYSRDRKLFGELHTFIVKYDNQSLQDEDCVC